MKKLVLNIGLLLFFFAAFAQKAPNTTANVWQTLALVTFDTKFDEMLGIDVQIPKYSPAVKKLEGKIVELKGYILPLEGRRTQTYFIFSAYPYSLCFFCGGAGPETVAEAYCKKPIPYTTKMITVRGKLALNHSGDIEKLMYTLTDVELVDN